MGMLAVIGNVLSKIGKVGFIISCCKEESIIGTLEYVNGKELFEKE